MFVQLGTVLDDGIDKPAVFYKLHFDSARILPIRGMTPLGLLLELASPTRCKS